MYTLLLDFVSYSCHFYKICTWFNIFICSNYAKEKNKKKELFKFKEKRFNDPSSRKIMYMISSKKYLAKLRKKNEQEKIVWF